MRGFEAMIRRALSDNPDCAVYMQGGLNYAHIKICLKGIIKKFEEL